MKTTKRYLNDSINKTLTESLDLRLSKKDIAKFEKSLDLIAQKQLNTFEYLNIRHLNI